jgi:uncharacterized membrane protein YuzA (DUF378 family)
MAKTAEKATREPGRIRQLITIYVATTKADKAALGLSLLGFAVPTALGLLIANVIAPGSTITMVLWGIVGGLAGVLVAMVIMSRRAESAAYARFEGQPGATGAVLNAALRRGWRVSDMPVHISPKTQEMVYRAVGPAGVVLIGEGSSRARVQAMVEDERRKVARIAPGVTTNAFYVIPGDEKSVPLAKLGRTILKLKRSLNRSEVSVVANRLESIGLNVPVPKGIDPSRMRAPRR